MADVCAHCSRINTIPLRSSCWQTCSATVVPNTTPLCWYAPGAPQVFCVNCGHLWVKGWTHFLPVGCADHRCPLGCLSLRGTRCCDTRAALQPLVNNGASLFALCIYVVAGLWQCCCVWTAYGLHRPRAGCCGAHYPCIVSVGKLQDAALLDSVDLNEHWQIKEAHSV